MRRILPPRGFTLLAIATMAAGTLPGQVTAPERPVLPGGVQQTLQRVVAAVADEPTGIILLIDPALGMLTSAAFPAGMDLMQASVQPVPGESALVHTGFFVRPGSGETSEVFLRSTVVAPGDAVSKIRFLNSTGRPESNAVRSLKANRGVDFSGPHAGELAVPLASAWDTVERLGKEGRLSIRVADRAFGVATVLIGGNQLGEGLTGADALAATLFLAADGESRTKLKINAVRLSTESCQRVLSRRLSPAGAILQWLKTASQGGVQGSPPASLFPTEGFCQVVFDPPASASRDALRAKAGTRRFARDPEQVWSSLLLVVRQYALVTAAEKSRWQLDYAFPCRPGGITGPTDTAEGRVQETRRRCGTTLWLEPAGFGTDLHVFLDQPGETSAAHAEALFERIATQLFADERLKHLLP